MNFTEQLLHAIDQGDVDFIQPLSKKELPSYCETKLLYRAVNKGRKEIVELFLNMGIAVNLKDLVDGNTPLHTAASSSINAVDIIRLLINRGANVDMKNIQGETPLYCAVRMEKSFEVVEILLNAKSKIDTYDSKGDSLFYKAVEHGAPYLTVINRLLEKGVDLRMKNYQGNTPLHLAAQQNDLAVVELLLNNGAKLQSHNDEGATPLHFAVQSNEVSLTLINLLLGKGADINKKDKKGDTPLNLAIQKGHREIVELFSNKEAELYIRDKKSLAL